MMRYSEITRDFSSDSMKCPEDFGEKQIYQTLRDDSPIAERKSTNHEPKSASKYKDFATPPRAKTANAESQNSGGHFRRNCDKKQTPNSKDFIRRRNNSTGGGILPIIQQTSSALVNQHFFEATTSCFPNYSNLMCSTPPSSPVITSCIMNKTQSLPPKASISDFDVLTMNALRISPEELAGQITLLDYPAFVAIHPDELTSCAWTKKDKCTVAPNIVAFTRRFNHTSFWTIQEILSGPTPKRRAETMAHFIKTAKKLYELNNLHSLFAIVSAMRTASIFRLSKTWSQLSKKDRQTFDRLIAIFDDANNWKNLRDYLDSLKLPCIPYLGLFLTDLVYIDSAHPHSGGLESEQRRTQMNNILRIISNYQSSDYSHILPNAVIQKYIQSFRYIEELQNIFEDDQYKKSLILEPAASNVNSSSASNSSKESVAPATFHHHIDPSTIASLNLSPAKVVAATVSISATPVGSMRLNGTSKFIPGHRKCRSLGSKFRSTSLPRNFHHGTGLVLVSKSNGTSSSNQNHCVGSLSLSKCKCRIFNKANGQVAPISSFESTGCIRGITNACYENGVCPLSEPRHLLDDSLLVNSEAPIATSSRCASADELSNESADGANHDAINGSSFATNGACITPISYFETDSDQIIPDDESPMHSHETVMEGCVRRKTVLKEGRKPAVASWQRYWIELFPNSLLYFAPKSFKGSARSDFKREPCKMCFLEGWSVRVMENPQQINTFQLVNEHLGTAYKFRTGSVQMTSLWLSSLRRCCAAINQMHQQQSLPANLMSFE